MNITNNIVKNILGKDVDSRNQITDEKAVSRMKCPNCGAKAGSMGIRGDYLFCQKCGAREKEIHEWYNTAGGK